MRNFLKIFVIFCLTFLHQANSSATDEEIVAIINNYPITTYDLGQAQKIITILYLKNDEISQKQLRDKALEMIKRNKLIINSALELGVLTPDEEVLNHIAMMEKQNNFAIGYYQDLIKKNNIDLKYFKENIKADLIFKKILHSIASSEIATKNQIDRFFTQENLANLDMELTVFSSKDMSAQTYQQMNLLYQALNKGRDISKENWFKNFANLSSIQDIQSLSPILLSTVKFLNKNDLTSVLKTDEGFKIFMVSKKQINKLAESDRNKITRIIVHNKIMRSLQKFQDKLRRKAYIKVMENC
jgi:hypothetical protein